MSAAALETANKNLYLNMGFFSPRQTRIMTKLNRYSILRCGESGQRSSTDFRSIPDVIQSQTLPIIRTPEQNPSLNDDVIRDIM